MPSTLTYNETTYTFITLGGNAHAQKMMLEEITRENVDGLAVRERGLRGKPFELIGIRDCDDLADSLAKKEALEQLQGKIVAFVDDRGANQGNVICWEAEVLDNRKVVGASGGVSTSKGALLAMRFVMQKFS